MYNTVQTLGFWAINLTAMGVGLFLIWRALVDIGASLKGSNKEWIKFILGLVIGIIGGILFTWGGTRVLSFFQGNGQDIPL